MTTKAPTTSTTLEPRRSRLDALLATYTVYAAAHPFRVLFAALVVLVTVWSLALQLRVRGDFVRLLPSESGTAKRFLHTLERKGGGTSTLLVLIESPSPKANQRFVDSLKSELDRLPKRLIQSAQPGPEAERKYFEKYRWLFTSEQQLSLIACELRKERLKQDPFYFDLEDPCEEQRDDYEQRAALDSENGTADEAPAQSPGAPEQKTKQAARAKTNEPNGNLARIRERIEEQQAEVDRFPTGYFRDEEGSVFALVVRASAAGMGEFSTDELYERVQSIVKKLNPAQFHPEAVVGFAGDIPNAIAEREALIEDMTTVTVIAIVLVLGSILSYFRSLVALLHIGLAVSVGCGTAFAAAALAFGHLNAATSFLGAIVVGNGINDSIIYLSRYREQKSKGLATEEALKQAAVSTRRGTWLASVAASGAYAALMVTSFRGFSEFGLIGGVGMVACWFATFGFCPASIAAVECLRKAAPVKSVKVERVNPVIMRRLVRLPLGFPWPVLCTGLALLVVALWPLKTYLLDPWEYDFSKLRSESSRTAGAGHWSRRADRIFQSRGSPELLLAEDMKSALSVAKAVRARDEKTGGKLVERVVTIHDRLGGPPELLEKKLASVREIREELQAIMPRLKGKDRQFAEDWLPPPNFEPPSVSDLPPLVLAQFSEKDGTVGTPVYVYLDRKLSRSKGENLLRISDLLESVETEAGKVVPNASRATVFAEMIRSMERDAPRATLAALSTVVIVSLLATRAFLPALAVLGSLLFGVIYTVGGAAWFDVRLNFLNFVALPLTFGIGIEYAVNLYDRMRSLGGDIAGGIRSAGGAVTLCSLTTIFGYGSLLFADNLALQSFGKYAVLGELSCMATALLLMPAALRLWQVRSLRKAENALVKTA